MYCTVGNLPYLSSINFFTIFYIQPACMYFFLFSHMQFNSIQTFLVQKNKKDGFHSMGDTPVMSINSFLPNRLSSAIAHILVILPGSGTSGNNST